MVDERDWERLNAFADNELGPAETTVMRARLARDPDLAADLARIGAAKAALGRLAPDPVPGSARIKSRRWAAAALAASVVLAVGVSVTWVVSGPGSETWLTAAEIDDRLSARSYVLATDGQVAQSLGRALPDVTVPDFAAAQLTLVDIETWGAGPQARIAAHYRGRRGCRVTLLTEPADARADAAPPSAHRWQAQGTAYTLVADGMAPLRFSALGDYAEAVTGARAQDAPEPLRQTLEAETAAAPPCV
ncbi:MAG: hypothetical protein AAF183_08555 [Pseudomonadota bacterium]